MLLSQHFSLAEFTTSQAAGRLGLSNQPSPEILRRMRFVTAPGMEKVLARIGRPLTILSGYRSPKVNRAEGGLSDSPHLWGWAVSFICPAAGSPLTLCRNLADSEIEFDQLIHDFGAWVTISFEPRKRGLVLTTDRQGVRNGLLTVRRAAA